MLLNYADLLWRPALVEQLVLRFAPCLGNVSAWFAPRLGVDIVVGNKIKVSRWSVANFGGANSWKQAKGRYLVHERRCTFPEYMYKGLNTSQRRRAHELEILLRDAAAVVEQTEYCL